MRSQVLTSSTCGLFDRCGKYEWDTLPQPITPTFTFFGSAPVAAPVTPATAAAPRNVRRSSVESRMGLLRSLGWRPLASRFLGVRRRAVVLGQASLDQLADESRRQRVIG